MVTCAILDSSHTSWWLVILSDNQNTVDIWHLLKASTPYNQLLIIRIDKLIKSKTDARMLHVPGIDNDIADALSHFKHELALWLAHALHIFSFQPPHNTLWAAKKWSTCLPRPGNPSRKPGLWNGWTLSLPSTLAWQSIDPHTAITPRLLTHTSPSATFMVLTLNPPNKL